MAALSCALLLAAGSIFFPLFYVCVKNVFSYLFSPNLKEVLISNICVKFISSVQAVTTTCVGYTIMSSCHDVMNDRHWLTNSYALFVFPYFFYDTWAMYQTHLLAYPYLLQKKARTSISHFVRSNIIMMVHHVVLPFIYGSALLGRGGRGDFFVGVFYMIEIAIPFICVCRILILLNLKEQFYVKLAGVVMVVTFLISRLMVFPYLYWSYAVYANLSMWHVWGSIPVKCNVGCAILLLPQIYWFGLMIRGLFKVVICKKSSSGYSYQNYGDSALKEE